MEVEVFRSIGGGPRAWTCDMQWGETGRQRDGKPLMTNTHTLQLQARHQQQEAQGQE